MIAQSIVMSCLQVGVVARRMLSPLDRAWAGEADEVPYRAGLVVGAGRAGSAEGLLADDGAARLVVDVEVAGGVRRAPQRRRGILAPDSYTCRSEGVITVDA